MRTSLTTAELRMSVPSVFSTVPDSNVSDRYAFIPTTRVMNTLAESNWLPVSAQQTRARNAEGMLYSKHLLRFGNSSLPEINGCSPEIVLVNSHDRTACFLLMAGLFRLICVNGLIVADASFSCFGIRHIGYCADKILDAEARLVKEIPQISERISTFQGITLSAQEKQVLSLKAAEMRWAGNNIPVNPADLLLPRREEDRRDDLWSVFNCLQENLLRGGIKGSGSSRRFTTREIRAVPETVRLNKALWTLAESVRMEKTGSIF